jgi:hypothetical protein
MDSASACRLAIRVPAYVEQRADGLGDYHVTENWLRIVDKDTFNWMGVHELFSKQIVHGQDQELHVTFLDKEKNESARIDSDNLLLHAFDQYWDTRKLPLTVDVVDTRAWSTSAGHARDSGGTHPLADDANPEYCEALDMILPPANVAPEDNARAEDNGAPEDNANVADWGGKDEVEYVGVDDEKDKYKNVLDEDEADPAYYPDTDEEADDPLIVDDAMDCGGLVHVTNLDNPCRCGIWSRH